MFKWRENTYCAWWRQQSASASCLHVHVVFLSTKLAHNQTSSPSDWWFCLILQSAHCSVQPLGHLIPLLEMQHIYSCFLHMVSGQICPLLRLCRLLCVWEDVCFLSVESSSLISCVDVLNVSTQTFSLAAALIFYHKKLGHASCPVSTAGG